VPPDLEGVVMRCLEKDPDDRYQHVLDVRDALLNCENAGHWTRRLAQQWWQANGAKETKPSELTLAAQA
jgi:serine/threonine-protein kinase